MTTPELQILANQIHFYVEHGMMDRAVELLANVEREAKAEGLEQATKLHESMMGTI